MKYKKMELSKICAVAIFLMALMLGFTGCASTSMSPQAETSPAADAVKLITNITTGEDSGFFYVTVESNQPLTYTSVKQVSPLGVIFYFPETALDAIQTDYTVKNGMVEGIKASVLTEKGSASRIQIQLKKDVTYSVVRAGDGIKIAFTKPAMVAMLEKKETGKQDNIQIQQKKEAEEEEEQKAIDLTGLPPASQLESIYTVQSDKSIKIKIMADGVIKNYKSFTIASPARIVFDIFKLQHAQQQKKELLIPVNTEWVKSVRYFSYPDKLRLVIDTSKPYLTSFSAAPAENGLMIQVGSDVMMAAATNKEKSEAAPLQANPASSAAEKKTGEPAKAASITVTDIPPQPTGAEPAKETPITVAAAAPQPVKVEPPATANKTDEPAKATSITAAEPAPLPAAKKNPGQPSSPAWVNRIDFSSEPAGKSTLIIGTTRPIQYDIKKETDKRIQLKLFDTNLPDYRKRPLITTRFQSAVDRILPFDAPALKNTSLFAIELRETVPYAVEQTDNLLLVHFEASTVPPRPLDETKLPDWQAVMTQTTLAAAEPEKPTGQQPAATPAMAAPKESAVIVEEPLSGTTKEYTGEKIALDFYDTDIKNVFRILREVSRKNFAIDKGVAGKVTLTLEQPVPWDQVLDLILKMNGLGMTYEGDIIRIAKLETIEKEQTALQQKMAAERKAKREELKVEKELEPLVTEYISVNYANATSEILPKVKPIITKDRGSISVDDRNNQLIVNDVAGIIDRIRDIVKKIDRVTPQVLIEARIVEATNTFTRAIGTQWGVTGEGNEDLTNSLGGQSPGGLRYDMSATNPPTSSLGTLGINFTRLLGTPFSLVNARISASETEGDLNIISAPKILTLNNKKATIKQGVKYPYNKLVDGETTTEFINVDLLLEVEPLVTPDQRIAMKLRVTNNELGTIVNNQQSFTTKEAETELLVNDGETIVIGGIRKTTKRNDVSGVPVMKDIPVLGWLFKSKGITDNKEELLIFITPQIVQLEQRGG
ncbi:MAG: type IV pilus secretin PilQ [Desulfobacterales bacterium]|nr:type IV pilus secretin PilQ [Desulfobacterales bacterium]